MAHLWSIGGARAGANMDARANIGEPRGWARLAGFLWLVTIVFGVFAEGFVRGRLITDDAATTISNIAANESFYRLGEAALFVGTAAYLALTAIMYRLLAPVSRTLSLMAALFSTAGCVIWILVLIGDAAPLVLLTNGEGSEAARTLAFGFVQLHPEALLLGMTCFGVHCLLMGWLIVRGPFLPAIIGLILALGGLGYLAAGLLHIAAPELYAPVGRMLFVPGQLGEALIGLWLALTGVNSGKWKTLAVDAA